MADKKLPKYEVLDKNGKRRAYCKSKEGAEEECKRLSETKADFAPFEVAETKQKS